MGGWVVGDARDGHEGVLARSPFPPGPMLVRVTVARRDEPRRGANAASSQDSCASHAQYAGAGGSSPRLPRDCHGPDRFLADSE